MEREMARDDIELAYDAAFGYCIDAMYSLRRFSGTEAIDSFKSAIRAIERGQHATELKHKRAIAAARSLVESPPPRPAPEFGV